MLLQDRVVVITGAASGIGRALASACAARGCRLALVDRLADDLRAVAGSLPTQATTHVVDVADRAAVLAVAAEVCARHGAVHALINNAGVALAARLDETRDADLDWLLATNLGGVVNGCRAFLPSLRRQGGRIVNIASAFALVGFAGKTAYCASKFAVRGFSEALQAELHGTGVGVTVAYPGAVATGLVSSGRAVHEQRRAVEDDWLQRHGLPPAKVAARIVRALERDEARVVVGRDAWTLDVAARWCPRLLARWLSGRGPGRS